MAGDLLHTPDGVRDIYDAQCRMKMQLQDQITSTFHSFGYQDIQTPTIEFFDTFGRQVGTTPSKDLFKLFDKEGNTLVLRPDFTPSIARSAVKYFCQQDMPVKLCYCGETFVNSSDLQGRLKEATHCGVELIGDAGAAADAEILAMAAEALQRAGLFDFQISVGSAQYIPALLSAANATKQQEQMLWELLENKNFYGVAELVESMTLSEDLRWLFSILGSFDLKEETLRKALLRAGGYPLIAEALSQLLALLPYLSFYGIEKYISFELGLTSSIHYYSGILFRGYTYGTGEPIVSGGRYDGLLGLFGRETPAIGFVITVDVMLDALSWQGLLKDPAPEGRLLAADFASAQAAIARASALRAAGERVQLLIADPLPDEEACKEYAQRKNLAKVERIDGER